MAVEIPVVIDIDQAFKDAAAKVGTAIKPLQSAIDDSRVNIPDLTPFIEKNLLQLAEARNHVRRLTTELKGLMSKKEAALFVNIDVSAVQRSIDALLDAHKALNQTTNFDQYIEGLTRADFELLQMREHYKELEAESRKMSDSVVGIRSRMSELSERWNAMTSAERGSKEGREVEEQYRREAKLLREQALTLDERLAKEEQVAQAAISASKRRAEAEAAALAKTNSLREKGNQSRRYENAILNSTVKTMRVLQEQERILSDRLSRTKVGTGTYDKLKQQLNDVRVAMGGVKKETDAASDSFAKQTGILGPLVASFASYVSVHSLLRFANQIREVTGELEYQRVALGHLIQDEDYGARLFERIKAAAIESPFRIKDLVTYTKQLAAYRIETTQLFDTTKRLADVSAGLGVDMNRLILAYGQVRAASVLRGQELRQFTEAGIPLVELLADKFTELKGTLVSTADVFKLISERAVPFSMISEIFQDLTDVGGQFYQMQETQAKTLQGRWEKLKDTFDIALQEIGESKGIINFRGEFELLYKVLELVAKNLRVVPKLLTAATVAWVGYRVAVLQARIQEEGSIVAKTKLTVAELRDIVAKKGNTLATKAYTRALMAQKAATNALSKSFWKLATAMLANPITAIITGVTALIALFFTFRKRVDKTSESLATLSEWTDTIERQGQVIGQNKRMDSLISRYERLSSKTKLTAKEQQALSQTMRTLQNQFKDVTIEIGNANNTVSSQVKSLRALNKQQKETAISTLQLTKAQIEQRLTVLGQQEQTQTASWLAAARLKNELEGVDKLNRKQRKKLRGATKDYEKYGEALNKTSGEINTLQNRLVSIDNILNPTGTTPVGAETDRLSKLRQAISDVTNAYKKYLELREYESKEQALTDIGTLFPSLAGWEPSFENMSQMFTDMLNKYSGDADATRLVEQAFANVKFDKIKDDVEARLKKLSNDIKRSETARKFYNDILELTGDQEYAKSLTVDVYGDATGIGKEFKDRLGEELYRALNDIEPGRISPDLKTLIEGDLTIFDFDDIKKHLDELPPKVKKIFEDAIAQNEKFEQEWYKSFISTFNKAEGYESRIAVLNSRRAQKLAEVKAMGGTQADEDAVNAYFDKEVAGVELEALKNTYEWTKAFEDLEGVSDRTLTNLIALIEKFIDLNRQNLTPEQLKELTRQLEQVKVQKIQRHSVEGLTDALKKYEQASERRNQLEAEGKKDTQEYVEATDDQKRAVKELSDAYAALTEELGSYIASTKELMSTLASDEDASYWSSQLDNLSKYIGGVGKFALGLASIATGNVTPQAIAQTVSGLADMVSGVFGGIKAKQIRDANKAIDAQDEKLKALSKSYDHLGEAMANSFGSDYIYNFNQQLDILLAKQKAYEEQAKQEESKGKKADKKKAEEYRQSAEEATEEIEKMKGKLAEFFTGTDVTSAAKDFANAWIEAYKEFGSTTDAMKEKFQDMIQNMVTQSVAAKIMQDILQPLFNEIDEMAKEGGELSAEEIAKISKETPAYISKINDSMTTLMAQLSAAGYNMRQQAGKFTGISRDIASASEESILGLAAGINTQNAYMSMISTDVRQILALMGGGTTQTATPQSTVTTEETGVAEMPSVQKMVYDHLPNIDSNISAILTAIHRVIKTEGSQSYVSVRM